MVFPRYGLQCEDQDGAQSLPHWGGKVQRVFTGTPKRAAAECRINDQGALLFSGWRGVRPLIIDGATPPSKDRYNFPYQLLQGLSNSICRLYAYFVQIIGKIMQFSDFLILRVLRYNNMICMNLYALPGHFHCVLWHALFLKGKGHPRGTQRAATGVW